MTRPEILDAAKACVCGERNEDYGKPEDNFATIAEMWNSYLYALNSHLYSYSRDIIGPADVAAMMILLKVARGARNKAHDDNWIDLAGYAACAGEITSAEAVDQ